MYSRDFLAYDLTDLLHQYEGVSSSETYTVALPTVLLPMFYLFLVVGRFAGASSTTLNRPNGPRFSGR